MEKISIENLINKLKQSGELIILSTDYDPRFAEAKKIVETEVPNLKFKHPKELINDGIKEELLELYIELRKGKETPEELKEKINDDNIISNLLVKAGYAAGIVSGATFPTSEILRPAFQIIKSKRKGEAISSLMWLSKEGKRDLFFADISVLPEPDEEQLAQIAVQTAKTVESVFGIKPVVAMLSFSTNGSGGVATPVEKVRNATKIAKEKGIEVYGEIQWDAATRSEIFASKMKIDSPSIMPNVFIFPDLNSGNIGYKIATGLGEYHGVGPILQNISSPVNDLSRGCSAKEMADLVIITALQAVNKN